MTLRTSQSARNIAFPANTQAAINDFLPYVQQSILTANSAPVNASTALIDSGLAVEMSSAIAGSPAGSAWIVRGFVNCTTTGAAGIQFQLTASDGLNVVASNFTIVEATAGAVVVANVAAGAPATSGAVNVIAATIEGCLTVTGEGRLKLQFTQAVSTATNTTVNTNSVLEAYTVLP